MARRRRADQSARAPQPAAPTLKPAPLPAGVAFFIRNLANPRERREGRSDILDTPVLPGSIVKAVTLVTALEAGVIRPDTEFMCRREVTVDGVRFVCAHPICSARCRRPRRWRIPATTSSRPWHGG